MAEPALRQALVAIGKAHQPYPTWSGCQGCDAMWPCETTVLLNIIWRLIETTVSGGPVNLD